MAKAVKKTNLADIIDYLPITKKERKQVNAVLNLLQGLNNLGKADQQHTGTRHNDNNIIDIDYEEIK